MKFFLHRVRLDTAENWKLKLKTEKYCSKIIFKCVNSTVGLIFNEKVTEKWNLWVREQYTMCTDWLEKVWKVKICGYCSLNSTWTVITNLKNAWKKKKKLKNANALVFSVIQTQAKTVFTFWKAKLIPWSLKLCQGDHKSWRGCWRMTWHMSVEFWAIELMRTHCLRPPSGRKP